MLRLRLRRKRWSLICAACGAVGLGIGARQAGATTKIWTNSLGGSWNTSTNWNGGVPTINDGAEFPNFSFAPTVSLSTNEGALALLFAGNYTLSGGTLTLNNGGIEADANVVINSSLTALSGFGTHGLTKTGNATLLLGGTNTFEGTVAINAGTLQISADNGLGNAANAVNINGGTLKTTGSFSTGRTFTIGAAGGAIAATSGQVTLTNALSADANAFTSAGSGTLVLSSASSRTGTSTIKSGTLRLLDVGALGSGALTVTQNGTLELAGLSMSQSVAIDSGSIRGTGNSTYTGTITCGTDAVTFGLKTGTGLSDVLTIGTPDALVGGGSGNMTVGGSGTVRLPYDNSSFAGSWEIDSGTLHLENSAALGSTTMPVTLFGGVLELNSINLTKDIALYDGTRIRAQGSNVAETGTITVQPNASATLESGANSTDLFTVGGVGTGLTGGSGATLHVTGSGITRFNQPSSYTGSWSFDGGTAQVQWPTALGTGTDPIAVNNGATIDIAGITLSRDVALNDFGAIQASSGTAVTTGVITVPNNGTVFLLTGLDTAGRLTIGDQDNDLTGGGGTSTIITAGLGTVVPARFSNYVGAWSINGGTLEASADQMLGNGANPVTLNGGVLALTGSFITGRSLTVAQSNGGVDVFFGKSVTMAGFLNGSGTLNSTGPGTLVVTAASSRTAPTNITEGTVVVGFGQSPCPLGPGDITLSLGGALEISGTSYTSSGSIGNVNFAGLGTLRGTGQSAYAMNVNVGSNSVTLATSSSTSDLFRVGDASHSISGSSSSTVNIAGGGTVELPAANPGFSGGWNVKSGVLRVSNSGALGNPSIVAVQSGGVLENYNVTLGNSISLSSGGALRGIGTAAMTGTINVPSNAQVTLESGSNGSDSLELLNPSGNLQGGSSSRIYVEGGGGVYLNYANTGYLGDWTVNSGTLDIRNAMGTGALNDGITVSGTGTVTLDGISNYGADMLMQNGGALRARGNITYARTVSIDPGATVTLGTALANTDFLNLTGAIVGGSDTTIHVNGPGDVQVNQNSPYSGSWSVDGGLLAVAVANGLGTGTSSVAVSNASSLQLQGGFTLARGVTLNGNSTLRDVNSAGISGDISLGTGNENISVLNSAGTLTASGNITGSGQLAKLSPGTLLLSGNNNIGGGVVVSGGTVMLNGGSLTTPSIQLPVTTMTWNTGSLNAAAISLVSGKMIVTARNTSNYKVLRTDHLTIDAGSRLDLNDNDLVVNDGDFSTIQNLVFTGYRTSVDGSAKGIVSTTGQTSAGNPILAVLNNALVGSPDYPFGSGQTIAAGAVFGKYTYFGDTNLDGQVTADDYGALDANFGATGVDPGVAWIIGDTNFDGSVTADDYGALDANFGLGVGNPLSAQGAAAVPEVSGVLGVGMVLGLIARRKRRQ